MENSFNLLINSNEGLILFSSIVMISYLSLLSLKDKDIYMIKLFQTKSKLKFSLFFLFPIFIFIYFIILKINFSNYYINFLLFIFNIISLFLFILYLVLFLYIFYYFLTKK